MPKSPLLGKGSTALCSVLEYAFSLAAAPSVISPSAQLGEKTFSVWACTNKAMPLVWTFMSVAIHATAASGYKFALHSSNRQLGQENPSNVPDNSKKSARKAILGRISPIVQSEFRIRVHRQQLLVHPLDGSSDLSGWGVLLICSSGLASFCHLVFGTLVFSSLTFISVYDFLNYVFWRYIAAATVCKIIIMIDLAGLRAIEMRSEQQPGGASTGQPL